MSDTQTGRRPTSWRWIRLGLGALLLAALVARTGTGPFLAGLRLTTTWSLVAATAVTAATTVCCAWRWQLVAEGLGVRIGLGAATAAIYRSQFLNATLPGGVVGDLDRAVGHARRSGSPGPALRSVAWERALGQAVQVGLTIVALLLLPSPLRGRGVVGAAVVAAVGVLVLAGGYAVRGRAPRLARVVGQEARSVLRDRRRRLAIVGTSALAALGHLSVFVLAARVAGVEASSLAILPLAGVVLLGAAVPLNVAGWGPREGVAAWAFGLAGLGLDTGVTAAVAYGVMALVATLPGAVVLLAGRARRQPEAPCRPALEEAACA
jgi:uncharacterized membrane protein YbhN (UPF0104 family)